MRMSPGKWKPIYLGVESQRSRVPTWVFALSWVLASSSFFLLLLSSHSVNKQMMRTFEERSPRRPWWTVEIRRCRCRAGWRYSSTCVPSWTCTLYGSDLPSRAVELRRSPDRAPTRNRAARTPSCFRSASPGGSFLHSAVNHQRQVLAEVLQLMN